MFYLFIHFFFFLRFSTDSFHISFYIIFERNFLKKIFKKCIIKNFRKKLKHNVIHISEMTFSAFSF